LLYNCFRLKEPYLTTRVFLLHSPSYHYDNYFLLFLWSDMEINLLLNLWNVIIYAHTTTCTTISSISTLANALIRSRFVDAFGIAMATVGSKALVDICNAMHSCLHYVDWIILSQQSLRETPSRRVEVRLAVYLHFNNK